MHQFGGREIYECNGMKEIETRLKALVAMKWCSGDEALGRRLS